MSRPACERKVNNNGTTVWNFHGSRFGGCQHGQVMSLKGHSPAPVYPNKRVMFELGSLTEKVVKETIVANGFGSIIGMSANYKDQESVAITKGLGDKGFLILRCSLDGIYSNPFFDRSKGNAGNAFLCPIQGDQLSGNEVCLEVKSFKSDKFQDFASNGIEGLKQYRWQVSAQVAGLRKERWKGQHRGGVLVVGAVRPPNPPKDFQGTTEEWFDENFTNEYAAWYYAEPPYTEEQCLGRCEEVVHHFLGGYCPPCDSEWQPCDYPEDLPTEDDLAQLAEEFNNYQREAEYYQRLYEVRYQRLDDEMKRRGLQRLRAGSYTVDTKRGKLVVTKEAV